MKCYLLYSGVRRSVLKLGLWVHSVEVLHVGDDVVCGVLTLGDVCQHRRILWLGPSQLVVGKGPLRFHLGLGTSLDLFL